MGCVAAYSAWSTRGAFVIKRTYLLHLQRSALCFRFLVSHQLIGCLALWRRFWSTFSHFDDAALEAGIAEVDASYPGELDATDGGSTDTEPVLRFVDKLVFVTGCVPA